jgi:hypothetical protein
MLMVKNPHRDGKLSLSSLSTATATNGPEIDSGLTKSQQILLRNALAFFACLDTYQCKEMMVFEFVSNGCNNLLELDPIRVVYGCGVLCVPSIAQT